LSVEILFAQKMDSASAQAVDTTVFTKVDIEPSVDIQQWIDHLTKNLQPYIDKAAKNGMKPGQYTINVRFLVEKDGSISYAEA
jgi:periplasmic protein TonB